MGALQLSESPGDLLGRVCNEPIRDTVLLAENKYCRILRATRRGEPVVFKAYKTEDDRLARLEAEGVSAYHSIAKDDPALIDSDVVAYSAEDRVVGIGFVEGERLADHLRAAAKDRARWGAAAEAMGVLGRFLARMRQATIRPGAALDPFHFEYLRHCTAKLRGLPLGAGRLAIGAGDGGLAAIEALPAACALVPSRAHGDFVLRNIHIHGGRIGIIDFANTLAESHSLNDLANLWFSLRNMRIPRDFRDQLWSSVLEGLGPQDFPGEAERFFHEWHRRRWLMLNLGSRDPRRWAGAARALAGFARPWERLGARLVP